MFAMFIGAMLLSMSERTISSAGAFSLSGYYDLNSIESVIDSQSHRPANNWSRIEADNINVDSFSQSSGLKDVYQSNGYHFLVCNGDIGSNGQIVSTEIWQQQLSEASESTIRIGLIVAVENSHPSEVQIKRTEILAASLARKFNIPAKSIFVPLF